MLDRQIAVLRLFVTYILITIKWILESLDHGIIKLSKCHPVSLIINVVSIVDPQHLLFVDPVRNAIEDVINNT